MKIWITVTLFTGGCTEEAEAPAAIESPRQLKISSETAIAYLSCMADHPPLVNPIVFVVSTVAEGEDYCRDDSFQVRLHLNDAVFLDDPIGSWTFTGSDGFLSLEPDDGTPRFRSNLLEFRERETEVEFCLLERVPFEQVSLNITHWDWTTFEANYSGALANGDTVDGRLSGLWREDIVDCD